MESDVPIPCKASTERPTAAIVATSNFLKMHHSPFELPNEKLKIVATGEKMDGAVI